MNKQALLFIKNVVFAVGANMSQIMTTMVLTMIMPKIMTVQAYSYWQLYHFYTTYLQYSSLGWCEGLYIKYGGADYHELDRGALSSQVRGIVLHELIFAALFLCVVLPQVKGDLDRYVILTGAAAYMVLRVTRFQLQTILQASNRIVEYARAYSGERILFLILSAVCIIIGKKLFRVYMRRNSQQQRLFAICGMAVPGNCSGKTVRAARGAPAGNRIDSDRLQHFDCQFSGTDDDRSGAVCD